MFSNDMDPLLDAGDVRNGELLQTNSDSDLQVCRYVTVALRWLVKSINPTGACVSTPPPKLGPLSPAPAPQRLDEDQQVLRQATKQSSVGITSASPFSNATTALWNGGRESWATDSLQPL